MRAFAWGTFAALLVLSLAKPAVSHPSVDLAHAVAQFRAQLAALPPRVAVPPQRLRAKWTRPNGNEYR